MQAGMLSIGEVAQLAGVTTRTLRHYHATGLLPEPTRDSSGYRRYGATDVIAAVRVVRLRALGMPIPQITARLAGDGQQPSLARSLDDLAGELEREIDRLTDIRDRVRELVDSETLDNPEAALAHALRGHGLLGPDATLPAGETDAAALLDAVHPGGMSGALDQAGDLLADRGALEELGRLLQRYRALTAESDDASVDVLAREVADVLPRPANPAPQVDVDLMDKLLAGRLNGGQQRFMRRLRQIVDAERA